MPCLLVLIGLLIPRVTLFFMWIVGYTTTAFESYLWPLLGFLFMPYTTCAYAIGMNANGGFHGWSLVLLILAIIVDITNHGGSGRAYRRRDVRVNYTIK
jgi:hypothetical protein